MLGIAKRFAHGFAARTPRRCRNHAICASLSRMSTNTLDVAQPVKPTLRGVLHQWAAVFSFGAGAVLVGMTGDVRTALVCAVFATSLFTLFTVSATYHRVHWSEIGRARMRRLDHASIFLLIAGTYTPIAALGLTHSTTPRLLAMIWGGAALGILQSLFWVHAPKVVSAGLAVAVGWTIVPYFSEVRASLSAHVFGLIGIGGIAYTIGALAYASKRPNPIPGVFGYHEIFHALTILGALLHFIAVMLLVRGE